MGLNLRTKAVSSYRSSMEEKVAMVDGHMEGVVDQTRTTSTVLFAANVALVYYETGMTE
jgi:hypothetical protein